MQVDGNDRSWSRLAIIAGAGALPLRIAQACVDQGHPPFVIGLSGWADPAALARFDHGLIGVGEIGKAIDHCTQNGCDAVTFAGIVKRPDFSSLKVDWQGAKLLPRALAAARKGDDALMRVILGAFEKAGLMVVGAEQAAQVLAAPAGPLGVVECRDEDWADIGKAIGVARDLGRHDIGQGCVVCDGLVLAVEAQEGTDAMLARVAQLPGDIRGTMDARRGVLVKLAKPIQERRVDLPTVGVSTVDGVAAAGLAGIVVEAGGALVIDRADVAARADAHGVFVVGVADVDQLLADHRAGGSEQADD